MNVYRIGSSRHPANDGIGASLYGGRWNHKGIPVIYAAESRALCALEVLVNADELADDYVSVPIEIPDDVNVGRIRLLSCHLDGMRIPRPIQPVILEQAG